VKSHAVISSGFVDAAKAVITARLNLRDVPDGATRCGAGWAAELDGPPGLAREEPTRSSRRIIDQTHQPWGSMGDGGWSQGHVGLPRTCSAAMSKQGRGERAPQRPRVESTTRARAPADDTLAEATRSCSAIPCGAAAVPCRPRARWRRSATPRPSSRLPLDLFTPLIRASARGAAQGLKWAGYGTSYGRRRDAAMAAF